MLLKTLIIPIVDHKSRMEVQMKNKKLHQKYGKSSTYILISQDAIISKKNRMFGSKINVIGRTCEIHNSVNATSNPSPDPLFEDFTFNFKGNITLEEICPSNGSTHSSKWTFNSVAVIKLPIVCSLSSKLINCNAIKIKSGATKELHLSHYRMKIVEQKFEEEKINSNKTKFIRPNTQETPIIRQEPNPLLESKQRAIRQNRKQL